ncbi:unnamed protein product [Peniophora sp. CBMAI 1063]|nr:unnamed protein product [Peniophora sp. CBMAI 1063]
MSSQIDPKWVALSEDSKLNLEERLRQLESRLPYVDFSWSGRWARVHGHFDGGSTTEGAFRCRARRSKDDDCYHLSVFNWDNKPVLAWKQPASEWPEPPTPFQAFQRLKEVGFQTGILAPGSLTAPVLDKATA